MLTPYLPYPPSSGGQVRSYNLIKNLAKDHKITLFSLIKYNQEKEYIKDLKKYCEEIFVFKRAEKPWTLRNIFKTVFGFYPFLVIRNLSSKEKIAIKKKLKETKYDLIHAETFYVMPHLPKTNIPIALTDQTIEYQVYQHYVSNFKFLPLKPFLYFDVLKLKFWETKFWKMADKVIAVSQSDKQKMRSLAPGLKVEVIPNGAGEDLLSIYKAKKENKKIYILFQANFLWLQNIEAALKLTKEVFPSIRNAFPEAICQVVGQKAQEKLKGLKEKGVEIIDLDNSDIEGVKRAYKRATVFLAPIEGPGGTRLKILGAMAAGVPVVTTPVGIEGINAKNEKNVLVREGNKELADAVIKLLKDKKLYQRISQSARELVEKKYSYQTIAKTLSRIYKETINERKN